MGEDPTRSFGGRLKCALKAAGLTQLEAAKRIGVNKDTLTNYVKGRIPRTDRLNQLADLCNVSPEWLLWGRGRGPDEKPQDGRDPPRDRHFGQRLSDTITRSGFTLEQLVRELEIPEWELRGMLDGRISDALTLLKLADRLGVSMRWLLTGQDSKNLSYEDGLQLAKQVVQLAFDDLLKRARAPTSNHPSEGPFSGGPYIQSLLLNESASAYGEEKEKEASKKGSSQTKSPE